MDILNKTKIQNKILRAPEFDGETGEGGASSTSSNAIFIGGVKVDKFYLGNSDDVKIYLGDTLLYPTVPSYKLIARYNDTTEYIVECDGGTALTQSMVEGHTTPKSAMTSADISGCGMETFKVGDNSFCGATNLNSVTLNEGITEIGVQAFRDTPNLRSITFPSTLTTIRATSFRLSGLREVSGIPSGVTYLENGTFADCTSLTAATIPASVTGGSINIFLRDTALREVHFQGTTPPSFGENTFSGCTNLEKIYIPSCDNYDAYAASSVFSPYTNLIYAEDSTKCRSESYPFVFKREHKGGSAYTRACDSTSATTLTSGMTRSGTSISVITGTSNQVTAVTIGDCTKRVGASAFSGWSKVSSITISDSVQEIGEKAFFNHKVNNLVIPDSVVSIENSAFRTTGSTTYNSITIGDGCTSIAASAFTYNFVRVDIGTGITHIYSYAFYNNTCKTLICRAATPPACNTAAFGSWSRDGVGYPQVYVPDESVSAYKNASFWKTHSSSIHPLSELT